MRRETVVLVSTDAAAWAAGLDELHERLGKRFGRAEPRRQGPVGLQGLLAGTGARERVGNGGPDLPLKTAPLTCRRGAVHLRRRRASVSIC
jgi:hypothetical protein